GRLSHRLLLADRRSARAPRVAGHAPDPAARDRALPRRDRRGHRPRTLMNAAPDGSPVELYALLPVIQGTVEYLSGSRRWRHAFAMHVFADEAELGAALAEAGLRLSRRLDGDDGRW